MTFTSVNPVERSELSNDVVWLSQCTTEGLT